MFLKPKAPLRPGYKWELLGLLCFAILFHQGDRAIYGVLLPQISSDLQLTESQCGFIGTVLFLTLALMQPIAGLVGDRLPRAPVITVSILCWSMVTLLTGFAGGILSLVLLRSVLLAGFESFYSPTAYPLMAKFHTTTRSRAMSIHQAALYIGVMSSGFIGGWIGETWGWRHAFYIYGFGGILLGIVFIFRLRDTPKSAPAGETSDSKIQNSKTGATPSPTVLQSLGMLFRVPTALLLTAGFTAIVGVNNAYMVFAPKMLLEKFPDLSLTLAGGYSMFFHHITAFAGVLIGGALSDRFVRTRPAARVELQAIAMALGAPVIVWMGLAPSLVSICSAMLLFGFLRGLYESNTQAAFFDVIPPRFRATVLSMKTMVAFLIGSFTPLILGRVKDLRPENGYSYGFAALGFLWVIGAACLLFACLRTFKRDHVELD